MAKKRMLERAIAGLVVMALVMAMVPVVGAPALAASPGDIVISEIRIDQPSTDYDEYFELAADAGTSLDGLTYLVIGDGDGGSGVIEAVVDLTGQTVPSSGYFVAAESAFTLGTADLTVNLNFENSDNVTHLLVSGFTGADDDDLDTDDDGTLDVTPWTELLDLIALVESDPPVYTEHHYGPPTVGPDGSYVPGHAYQCPEGWMIGAFDPVGGDDTPGAANPCVTPVPEVSLSEIRIDQPSDDFDEYFELAADAGTSLDGLTYLVIGDGTGGSGVIEAVVDLTGQSMPASGYFVAAESTFTLGTADLESSLNFENSDNVTHLLVSGFTGANADDLDVDDDGVLDEQPWTQVVDCVALIETVGSGDQVYCETGVGPDGSYVPGHAYQCPEGWQIGPFDPAGGDDTPGAANACPEPEVSLSEVRIDQPSDDFDEYFELAAAAGTVLDGLTYLVIGDGTGGSGVIESVVDLTGQTVPSSGYFVAAESSFSLGSADLVTSLNFENSDNVTHLLVSGFTGANADDLDVDDDGVLDESPWTEVVDCVALIETVGSGDQVYCETGVGPDGSYVPGHAYQCPEGWMIGAFDPVGGDDTPGATNVCPEPEACGDPFTPIYAVQYLGDASPLNGQPVSIEGVVTGDFQNNGELDNGDLYGFYVQDPLGDENAATSDGIFVYDGEPPAVDVAVGDVVRVHGTVAEYNDLTEITSVSLVLKCGTGSVAPTTVELPVPVDLEPYEGMLVTFPQTLTASQNYFQGRYGQVTMSSDGRMFQPTNIFPPSPAADALAADNLRRMFILDDGTTSQNPDPIPYIGLDNTLRAGDTVAGLTGVVDYGFINSSYDLYYRLQPIEPVAFERVNERTLAPDDVGGAVKIASFNVLNYFNGDGMGGGFPTSRGADTPEEFTRQRDKIISAILAMDADVIGLMEIENDGYDEYSAIADLVNGLNDVTGSGTYAFIDPGVAPVGTDEIAVGMIYKPGSVTPVGAAAIIDSSVDPAFNSDYNRPAIAQTFERSEWGGRFTAVVNHLKSKGSDCDDLGDPDIGDGQGNCNLTREAAAIALTNWLETDPTGSGDPDFFIIGDLNSYAKEDPIIAIEDAGYTNLVEAFAGTWAYSYIFDGWSGYLDHALATAEAAWQVMGTTIWHINTDEPSVIDYNTEWKPQDLYTATPYRSSDHDPVVVGFCEAEPPTVEVSLSRYELWPPNHKYVDVTATVTVSDNFDPDPTVALVSVTSDELDEGLDDEDKPYDIVIVDDFNFQLRAERWDEGDGRTYTITYRVTDVCGNVTYATAEVIVPHDMGD